MITKRRAPGHSPNNSIDGSIRTFPRQDSKKLKSTSSSRWLSRRWKETVLLSIILVSSWRASQNHSRRILSEVKGGGSEVVVTWSDDDYVDVMKTLRQLHHTGNNETIPYSCPAKSYADSQWYGLKESHYPPPFLRFASYLYGQPPQLLSTQQGPHKICTAPTTHSDYTDGTNPSILLVRRLQQELNSEMYPKVPWKDFPEARYLVTTTFKKNHQCFVDHHKPSKDARRGREAKEADLLLLDDNSNTLWTSHIWDVRTQEHYVADDVRLFVYNSEVWISYKRYKVDLGPDINPKTQRINRLTFGYQGYQLVALVDSAREIELCCGRNFGALPDIHTSNDGGEEKAMPDLSFLTWPDPVWVPTVDMKRAKNLQHITLEEPPSHLQQLATSNFHGTSNQLLYVKEWNEYLGIGHIHRDRRWDDQGKDSPDAKFGHHYTHAFFTIQSVDDKFRLARTSAEFLFPSASNPQDAEIIQFASGLEWSENGKDIVITYGVNDCESFLVKVDWKTIESMLQTIRPGLQVTQVLRGAAEAWKN